MGDRHRVLLTRRLPDRTMDALSSHVELTCNAHDRPLTHDELRRMVSDQRGLVTMLTDRIDQHILDAAPDLKVIANYAVGFNNIDVAAARARGIIVTNTPGVLTHATADLTWALILAVTRRVVDGDRLVRSGRWDGWAPTQLLGKDLRDTVLGIVGMGRIGRAVSVRAKGFGMSVLYAARRPAADSDPSWRHVPFNTLIEASDIVSLHVTLTDETRHLIGADQLARMKPTAYLINTARGAVVDEPALINALREGRIAGAGLDVYEQEPNLHPELAKCPNTVLLPHLGSATVATRERMGSMVVENLLAVLEGRRPPNPVEP